MRRRRRARLRRGRHREVVRAAVRSWSTRARATRSPTASPARRSSATASRSTACRRFSSPESPGSRMRGSAPLESTRGRIGSTLRRARPSSASAAVSYFARTWSLWIVGKTSSISPRPWRASASDGAIHAVSTISSPSGSGDAVGRSERQVEPGVVADLHLLRGDPARERDELGGIRQGDAGLLLELPHRGQAVGLVVRARRRRPRRRGTPTRPAMNRAAAVRLPIRTCRPPDVWRAAAPQQDHRGGRPRLGRRARVQLLDGVVSHVSSLSTAATARLSNCAHSWLRPRQARNGSASRAGSSTTPRRGTSTGASSPARRSSRFPDDWFCPVCGARKKDFVPYEEWNR